MTEYCPNNLPEGGDAVMVTIPVWQPTINGLYSLLNWLDGFESAGRGNVPGHFELVMHFRSLRASLLAQRKPKEESPPQ